MAFGAKMGDGAVATAVVAPRKFVSQSSGSLSLHNSLWIALYHSGFGKGVDGKH